MTLKLSHEAITESMAIAEWKFAKSMPRFPHWYTLREKWTQLIPFDDVVMHIRDNGYKGYFFRKQLIYYDIGDFKYWTMGNPLDDTILINKAKISGGL